MKTNKVQNESMRRYLLGTLPEREQSALEDEYLNNDDCFEGMAAVESELIDSYICGKLKGQERRQFEQHYLAHPDRRERVEFSKALIEKINEQHRLSIATGKTVEDVSWWQRLRSFFQAGTFRLTLATSSIAVLLVILISRVAEPPPLPALPTPTVDVHVTYTSGESLGDTVANQQIIQMPSTPDLVGRSSPSVSPTPNAVFASLVLVVGGLRGDGETATPRLNIASNVDFVRLQIRIRRQGYSTYRAFLLTAAGMEVWSQSRLKSKVQAEEETITLIIPAKKVNSGDYILALRGVTTKNEVDDVSKSAFQVERK